MATITAAWIGTPAPTSVKMSDPTGAYGLRRSDNSAIIVADGADFTDIGGGIWAYDFTAVDEVEYQYWVEVVSGGNTYRVEGLYGEGGTGGGVIIPDTDPISSGSVLLTSEPEIRRLYSSVGVDLRTDDGYHPNIMGEIVIWASETIAAYTLGHYDTAVLAASPWVRRRATVLGAYYLSMRRGNAPQFVGEVKHIMDELEKIQNNKLLIPDSVVRAADVPTVSSYRIDDRYAGAKQRVVRSQSTKPYPGQPFYEHPSGGDWL